MSQIAAGQGAIKVSEVAVDEPQALLATLEREDAQTVINQIRKVMTDSLRRTGLLLTSRNIPNLNPGTIAWSGTDITFSLDTDIVVKLLQNESGSVVDLVMTYGATNTASTFNSLPLSNGQVLYIELDRALVPGSGSLALENAVSGGSLVIGKTVKVGTAGPALASAMSGATGTLAIPIAFNYEGHLWWIPHGIYWPPNTSSPLGAVVTSTSMPVGTIIDYHTFGGPSPLGYPSIKLQAPGWALCDGAVIIDPQSSLINPTRNPDGTPTLSYNPALDKFTPNMNGTPPTHSGANSYSEGDYVVSAGVYYVAVQAVPPGILISNTTYWQPEATYNNTSPANTFNKYRRTTQNQGLSSYGRGSTESFVASSASAYGGENTHVLTGAEVPDHTHSLQAHTHGPGTFGAQLQGSTSNTTTVLRYLQRTGMSSWSPNRSVIRSGGGDETFDTTAAGSFTHTAGVDIAGTSDGPSVADTGLMQSPGTPTAHNNEPRYHKVIKLVRIY